VKLTPEQHAVLHGHTKVLLYHMKCADGERAAYSCKALGFIHIVTFPPLKRGKHRRPDAQHQWHLDGDNRTFRTLGALADAIIERQKRAARMAAIIGGRSPSRSEDPAVCESERCGDRLQPSAQSAKLAIG
jgi:hypothetical protein